MAVEEEEGEILPEVVTDAGTTTPSPSNTADLEVEATVLSTCPLLSFALTLNANCP